MQASVEAVASIFNSGFLLPLRANERLFELKHANLPLSDSLREVQKSLGHALPLSSYLHKPVQRILKYHLIFKVCYQRKDIRLF